MSGIDSVQFQDLVKMVHQLCARSDMKVGGVLGGSCGEKSHEVSGVGEGSSGGGGDSVGAGSVKSGSSASWDEMMQEDEDELRRLKSTPVKPGGFKSDLRRQDVPVQMPERSGGGSCPGVKFGQFSNLGDGSGGVAGFFATYVRVPEVRSLCGFLRVRDVLVSKQWMEELALARFSQATVPVAFNRGRERLRMLAKVGDSVMSAVMVSRMYFDGSVVGDVQSVQSRMLSRHVLTMTCVKSGLSRYIVFPANVDPNSSSVGGEAVEAIAGVVFHAQGLDGVELYMKMLQLLL